MTFFGIGPLEIFVIFVIALLIFGPDRLPQAAMQIGRWVGQFRRWSADMTNEFREVTKEFSSEFEELRNVTLDLQNELRGVQEDLANEMRQVAALSQGQGADESALTPTAVGGTQTWAPASAGATTTWENGSSQETAMVAAPPPVATKDDPRADVSVFDLDEVVLMPRTARPVLTPLSVPAAQNGHLSNGHAAEAELPPRPRRSERVTRTTYARPARRSV